MAVTTAIPFVVRHALSELVAPIRVTIPTLGVRAGIGYKTAVKLMKKHGSLEKVLEALDPAKYTIPEKFDYVGARKLFHTHEVMDPSTVKLQWTNVNEEGCVVRDRWTTRCTDAHHLFCGHAQTQEISD